jgi:hypothetical protein
MATLSGLSHLGLLAGVVVQPVKTDANSVRIMTDFLIVDFIVIVKYDDY